MSILFRIKRRLTGSPGAPASLMNGELAINEVDNILYYGKGDNAGVATSVIPLNAAGSGTFSTTLMTLDFGDLSVGKTFTFSLTGASLNSKVLVQPSSIMPGSLSPDELEMDGFLCSARGSAADTVTASIIPYPGPVSGQRNFLVTLG